MKNTTALIISILFILVLYFTRINSKRNLSISVLKQKNDSLETLILNQKDTIRELRIVYFKKYNVYDEKSNFLLPNYKLIKRK